MEGSFDCVFLCLDFSFFFFYQLWGLLSIKGQVMRQPEKIGLSRSLAAAVSMCAFLPFPFLLFVCFASRAFQHNFNSSFLFGFFSSSHSVYGFELWTWRERKAWPGAFIFTFFFKSCLSLDLYSKSRVSLVFRRFSSCFTLLVFDQSRSYRANSLRSLYPFSKSFFVVPFVYENKDDVWILIENLCIQIEMRSD